MHPRNHQDAAAETLRLCVGDSLMLMLTNKIVSCSEETRQQGKDFSTRDTFEFQPWKIRFVRFGGPYWREYRLQDLPSGLPHPTFERRAFWEYSVCHGDNSSPDTCFKLFWLSCATVATRRRGDLRQYLY